MLRKENGITMITLVVTIIVTMILAAVSITYIAGEDNFLEQAEEAANTARVAGVQDLFQYYVAADYAEDKDVFGTLMANGYVKKINNSPEPPQTSGSVFYITQNGMNEIAGSYANTSKDEIIYQIIPELATKKEVTIDTDKFKELEKADVYLVDAALNVAYFSNNTHYGEVFFADISEKNVTKWWTGESTPTEEVKVVNWDKQSTAQESFVLNPSDINNQGTITGFAIKGADMTGTYNGGDLVIPSEIIISSGVGQVISVPVTKIAEGAFSKEEEYAGVNSDKVDRTINITGNVYIPSSVKEIGANAFSGQENITAVYIASEDVGAEAFQNCKNITGITFADGITKNIGEKAFYGIDTALTSVNFSEGVTTIGKEAFAKCNKLSNIVFPATLTTLGESAFAECSEGNKVIDLSRCVNLTTISEKCFYKCNNIKTISFAEGLKIIGTEAFANCSNCTIQDLNFPDSLTTIKSKAFGETSEINGNIYVGKYTNCEDGAFLDKYKDKIQGK